MFYANKDKKESLYMFDIASRKLTRLPIKELGVAAWSHDGEHLLVSHTLQRSRRTRLIWYRTSDWTKAHSVLLPRETMTVNWAQSLPHVPFGAVVLLSDRNLYLVQGSTIQQLTTTGDVVAFRVFPKEKRLRWVRYREGIFLAVFERNLTTMAVKRRMRIDLSPFSGMILACRFSPNGERLAWEEGTGIFVVTIATQQIHCLISFSPSESETVSAGFDWYGDDTLLILNNKLEILTFTIQQPSL
jgi:dipeptidyl aminopeptidase/acylaminoacyl peptidase